MKRLTERIKELLEIFNINAYLSSWAWLCVYITASYNNASFFTISENMVRDAGGAKPSLVLLICSQGVCRMLCGCYRVFWGFLCVARWLLKKKSVWSCCSVSGTKKSALAYLFYPTALLAQSILQAFSFAHLSHISDQREDTWTGLNRVSWEGK